MAISINKHFLSGLPSAKYDSTKATPNLFSSPEFKKSSFPDSIIIHYTAMSSAALAVNALTNPKVKASAHLVIAKNGKVHQLAPFNYRTWHAGTSEYNGRKYFNNFSIGIEIDNLGWLDDMKNGDFGRKGKVLAQQSAVEEATHWNKKIRKKYWEKYTSNQIERVTEICKALMEVYGIQEVLGHDEISIDRKQDPGPLFPMEELRRELFNDRSQEGGGEGEVTASLLNIRNLPSASGQLVSKPLQRGTKVEILEREKGWLKVKTTIEGWVSGKYIE